MGKSHYILIGLISDRSVIPPMTLGPPQRAQLPSPLGPLHTLPRCCRVRGPPFLIHAPQLAGPNSSRAAAGGVGKRARGVGKRARAAVRAPRHGRHKQGGGACGGGMQGPRSPMSHRSQAPQPPESRRRTVP